MAPLLRVWFQSPANSRWAELGEAAEEVLDAWPPPDPWVISLSLLWLLLPDGIIILHFGVRGEADGASKLLGLLYLEICL